ncbi:hypothetical protein PMIN03_011327 [Paraphaeosphaeria minitans]|uniref:Uncharacterized protein n=1 Tax=Paraphaeosphaeria minitans TaxID=565426 RepID=A0A9P6KQ35_9PLEO|nr:hypothetical protein PMIN01_07284 [Paraphaeosphaeria minitans]
MKSPKAEFNRLALDHLGWAPAGQKWCSSWKECFGEEYVWNGHATNAAAAQTTTELSAPLGASSTASDNVSGEVVLSGSSISVLCLLRLAAAAAATTTAAYFDNKYGKNVKDLAKWQKLCFDIGIEIVPKSITQYKEVNSIIDEIFSGGMLTIPAFRETSGPVPALRKYSLDNHKVYPLSRAKQDTILKSLLHALF